MARKFFYDKVHNTKKSIINLIIIGVCVIGVIVCFIVVSSFEAEDHRPQNGNLSIKSEITVEVNQEISKEIFFSKIENVNLNDVEIKFPEDYDKTKVGKYIITLVINNKDYTSELNIVDTTKPELVLKNVQIEHGKVYVAKDFVKDCIDNSGADCKISFYTNGVDEEGNKLDYSKYTNEGTYQIKIAAEDGSGNQMIEEATLTIGKEKTDGGNNTTLPVTCKYGDNNYDTKKYLLAVNVTTNKCAVSLDLYKDESLTKELNKIMDNETTKIKRDVEALNLTGTLALNRKITAVINNAGSGIVGYEIKMTVTLTNNNETKTLVDYKVNSYGKRIFTTNPYNLAS